MKTITDIAADVIRQRDRLAVARAQFRKLEAEYIDIEAQYLSFDPTCAYVNCLIGKTLIVPADGAWDERAGQRLQFFEVGASDNPEVVTTEDVREMQNQGGGVNEHGSNQGQR